MFYGWIVLVIGTFGVLMTVPGQTIGVSAFTDLLIRDLNISRSNLSLAYLLGTLSSSLLLAKAGRIYDRHGARLVGTGIVVALGSVLLFLASLPETVWFVSGVLGFIPVTAVTFVLITTGFFLLRFTGQGVLSLVSRNMVLKWFDRRRGLATALVGVATTLGFSSLAITFNSLIGRVGWQMTWRLTGLFLAVPFALLFLVLARDNPAECGLQPDGGSTPVPTSGVRRSRKQTTSTVDFTLLQARQTLTFWVILGTVTLGSLYFTGLTFNIVSIFEAAGYSRAIAIGTFFPASVIALILNFLGGWISDHIRMKYLVVVQILGIITGAIATIFLSSPYMVVLLIIAKGINGGMFGIVSSVPWPRFYGLLNLGSISGFVMGWSVAGSALGPYFFSLSLDFVGGYGAVSLLTAGLALGLLVLSPLANRPRAPRDVAAENAT